MKSTERHCAQVNIVPFHSGRAGDSEGHCFSASRLSRVVSHTVSAHQSRSKGISMASTGIPRTAALIPGVVLERDALTYRQSGAMGGPAFGSANVQKVAPQ